MERRHLASIVTFVACLFAGRIAAQIPVNELPESVPSHEPSVVLNLDQAVDICRGFDPPEKKFRVQIREGNQVEIGCQQAFSFKILTQHLGAVTYPPQPRSLPAGPLLDLLPYLGMTPKAQAQEERRLRQQLWWEQAQGRPIA